MRCDGFTPNTILGGIRNPTTDILKIEPEKRFNFVWIVNWPLFEFANEENIYVSIHHLFASPVDEDIGISTKDFQKARAR